MYVISAGTDGDADGEGSESSDQKVCSFKSKSKLKPSSLVIN